MLVNEELLIVLRQPQLTGSSQSICLATSGLEVKFLFPYPMTNLMHTLLTLRSLTLYIYMEHLFLMFLDHTQRRSTVGRTPLDE